MIRRFLLASVLALAACERAESTRPEPAPSVPATAAPEPGKLPDMPGAPVSVADRLTAGGYGPLRIGMSRAEVEAAMGPDADPEAVGGPDPASCDMFRPARAPEGMLVMIEDGVLTSVWVSDNPAIETDRALNVGDPAAEVKRVYGAAAVATSHKYQPAPAGYVTVWSTADRQGPEARGLTYEIGADGRVESIAGGGSSILYVEGCA